MEQEPSWGVKISQQLSDIFSGFLEPKCSAQFSQNTVNAAVPLQAWSGPEGSRKLMFPDFMTTAQDGARLSALATAAFNPRK